MAVDNSHEVTAGHTVIGTIDQIAVTVLEGDWPLTTSWTGFVRAKAFFGVNATVQVVLVPV